MFLYPEAVSVKKISSGEEQLLLLTCVGVSKFITAGVNGSISRPTMKGKWG